MRVTSPPGLTLGVRNSILSLGAHEEGADPEGIGGIGTDVGMGLGVGYSGGGAVGMALGGLSVGGTVGIGLGLGLAVGGAVVTVSMPVPGEVSSAAACVVAVGIDGGFGDGGGEELQAICRNVRVNTAVTTTKSLIDFIAPLEQRVSMKIC